MKDILTLGVIGGLLFFGFRLFSAKRLGDKSVVRTLRPRVHKLNANGLFIRMELEVDNPTAATVTVTKPVVYLYTKGQLLASTAPDSKVYTIEPMATTQLDSVEFRVSLLEAGRYLASLPGRIKELNEIRRREGSIELSALGIPLEYSYSIYVNDLRFESGRLQLV
jgi:hypothetical protein